MKKILFYPTFIVLLCFIGCNKDKDEDKDKDKYEPFNETCEAASLSGLTAEIDGDISYEMTQDTAVMNQYIACVLNCQENNPDDPNCVMGCMDDAGLMDQGGAFSLSVRFVNITSTQITYTIVPGTWFFPGSDNYQPMLIAETVVVIVPAYETVTVTIPVFCLAATKSAPGSESKYTLCETVSSGCLSEIVEILKKKDMNNITFAQTLTVQDIIWACTDGEEEVDFEFLNGLPDLK
jgi:hypothetical protein